MEPGVSGPVGREAWRGLGLGRRAEPSGPARSARRKERWGQRSVHARPRRAAGPGQLSGLQPPQTPDGAPPVRPGSDRAPPQGADRPQGPVPASSGPHAAALRPGAGADSEAWACSPGVGESHRPRVCTLGGERVRSRADPSPESPGCGPGGEEVFRGRRAAAEEALPSAGQRFPVARTKVSLG